MSRFRIPLVAIPLALAVILGAFALSRPAPQTVEAQEPSAAGAKGLRVAFDPETGDMIPAERHLQVKGADALNRSHQGLVEVVNPDGSVRVDLEGRFQCYATATVDPQGDVQLHYGHDGTPAPTQIEE